MFSLSLTLRGHPFVRKAGAAATPPPPPEIIGAAASRIGDGGAAEGLSQLTPKDSRILASTGNKEIGRKSDEIDLGGLIFGAGMTTADFQISGTFPSLMEILNIAASGSAISGATSLSIQLGS